jgi:hypothetical protein
MHQRGIIVCDEPANIRIACETVRYFKDIESSNYDNASGKG